MALSGSQVKLSWVDPHVRGRTLAEIWQHRGRAAKKKRMKDSLEKANEGLQLTCRLRDTARKRKASKAGGSSVVADDELAVDGYLL